MTDVQSLVAKLAPFLKPIVEAIEASPEVCQGHYDQYMAAVTRLATMAGRKDDKVAQQAFGLLLIRAGANAYGVNWALKHIGALD